MGLFNEHSSSASDTISSGVQGPQGPPGPQGNGYKLTSDGNYDIENKKLINVKPGTDNDDVVIKSQIQYLDDVNPGQVINNRAVIYSNSGSIHSNALYLKDQYGQEVNVHTEDQDDNQIRLYIPNLKNNDSFGGRLKSSLVITSIEQTIEGKKVFSDIHVSSPTLNSQAVSKYYVDYNFLNRLTGGQIGGDLDMRGHSIKYLKLDKSDHAAVRVSELNLKADKSDLDDYLKLDGTKAMTDNLNMNNNRILRLPHPLLSDEPATKGYVSQLNNNLFNNYLDLQGIRKMEGNLNMNNHMITNVKTPLNDSDAINKGYFDNHSIQPAHPQKNALDYIMDDVDQTSSEYGIEIDKIDNYNDSFHSYNKKVIYLKLLKDGNNYRSRIGYNIFKLIDKSKDRYYTAVIEWLTTVNNVWNKMEIFNNITSGSIILNQTRKFEDCKGLYYTRSIIQFEVMAISTSPLYLLSTIHIDGVNPTYPAKYSKFIYLFQMFQMYHITLFTAWSMLMRTLLYHQYDLSLIRFF